MTFCLPFQNKIVQTFNFCFLLVVKCRNFLYEKGIFKVHKCDVPVVSVGNIATGGSGKTPFTLLLAKRLSRYAKVGIVSRGYKGSNERKGTPLVVSRGFGPEHPPSVCGDEPYLLSQNLPEAIVVVGANRVQAVKCAEKEGAKVVVLDDGLQHRKLHRDIEIVLVNEEIENNGSFVRDEPKRLKNADLVVLPLRSKTLHEKVASLTTSPAVEVSYPVKEVVFADPTQKFELKNASVAILCAIARPKRFESTVKELGAQIVESYFAPDHARISPHTIKKFAQKAAKKGAQVLLCTEKDFVKISRINLVLPLAFVQIEARVSHPAFEEVIEKIKSRYL